MKPLNPPPLSARSLRPMRLIEIFDRATELVRQNAISAYTLSILGWLPFLACFFGFLFHSHHQKHLWGTSSFLATSLFWLLPLACSLYILLFLRASQLLFLYSSFTDAPLSLSASCRQIWKKRRSLFFVGPFSWILCTSSGLLLFFPLPFLLVSWFLLLPVVALESNPESQAFSRTHSLSKKLGSRHFTAFLTFRFLELILWLNFLFLFPLLTEATRILFSIDLSWLSRLPFRLVLLWLLGAALLHPWKTCVLALLYLDACIRHEGWDLNRRFLWLQESYSPPPNPHPSLQASSTSEPSSLPAPRDIHAS